MTDHPRILATRRFPDAVEARLHAEFDVVTAPDDGPLGADGIVALAAGCRGIFTSPTERFDAALIARLPASVEIIVTFSVGCDHIDLEAAKARGLAVTNTPDVLTDATADTTMLCLLGAARMAQRAERVLREGQWTRWAPTQLLGIQVTGKRLGIVGMGRIGQATAQRARGFDMRIHYHNRSRLPLDEEHGAIYHPEASTFLPQCDFLALTCPLTAQTHHWLNAERIAQLPDGAVVVNTSRGPVVDDEALIAALETGKIAAAGLDVFTGEPELDPRYLTLPTAFLLPHIGSATVETRNEMGFRCLDNLAAHFAGQPLISPVV